MNSQTGWADYPPRRDALISPLAWTDFSTRKMKARSESYFGPNVPVMEFWRCGCRRKRWRATAVQDAGARLSDAGWARGVL